MEARFKVRTFAHNTDAVISAMPDEGYSFSGWQGLGISDIHEATTTVSMLNDRSVTANFEPNKYELMVSSGLGGRVTGGTYNHGETAQISAIPSIGYEFVDWKMNESTDGISEQIIYKNRSMSICNFPNQEIWTIDDFWKWWYCKWFGNL